MSRSEQIYSGWSTFTPVTSLGKGPFTLSGIPAVIVRRGTLPSACCVYIRRETGGNTVGVMQMSNRLFTGNTISVVAIFKLARINNSE